MLELGIMWLLQITAPTLVEVAPLILVFVLILAAAGLTRGADMFSLFGIGTLIGLKGSVGGGGAGKGLKSAKIHTRFTQTLRNPNYKTSLGSTIRAATPIGHKSSITSFIASRNALKASKTTVEVAAVLGTAGVAGVGAAVASGALGGGMANKPGAAETLGYGTGIQGHANMVINNPRISNFRKGRYLRALHKLDTAKVNLSYADQRASALDASGNSKGRGWFMLPLVRVIPIPKPMSAANKAGFAQAQAAEAYTNALNAFHVQVYKASVAGGFIPKPHLIGRSASAAHATYEFTAPMVVYSSTAQATNRPVTFALTTTVATGQYVPAVGKPSVYTRIRNWGYQEQAERGQGRAAQFISEHYPIQKGGLEEMDARRQMARDEARREADTKNVSKELLNSQGIARDGTGDRLRAHWDAEREQMHQQQQNASAAIAAQVKANADSERLGGKLDEMREKEARDHQTAMQQDEERHQAWMKHLKELWSQGGSGAS